MIAVCVPVTSWEQYERFALPGIIRILAAAPDTLVLARESIGSYQQAANAFLDEVAACPDLEGTVIIHQDVELLNANAATILPDRFSDPQLAILGSIGARYRSGITWWAAEARGSRIELPDGYPGIELSSGYRYVASVDGVLLAMSPWASRTLRFDLRFERWFHGYDMDICLQARAHGRLVAVEDLPIRHAKIDGLQNGRADAWVEADVAIRRKWDVGAAPRGLEWTRGPAPPDKHLG